MLKSLNQLETVELPEAQIAELEAIADREDWGWIAIEQAIEVLARKKLYQPRAKCYLIPKIKMVVGAFNAREVVQLIDTGVRNHRG